VRPTKVNTGFEARLPPKRVFGLPDVNTGRPISGWPSRPRRDMRMLVSGGHATQVFSTQARCSVNFSTPALQSRTFVGYRHRIGAQTEAVQCMFF